MLKWTVMMFVLAALSIDNAVSISCYSCNDYLGTAFGGKCKEPDTTTDEVDNCDTSCMLTLSYVASEDPTSYSRGCGDNCQASENIFEAFGVKTGTKTLCCKGELCNGGTTPTIGAVAIMVSAILTAVWITQ